MRNSNKLVSKKEISNDNSSKYDLIDLTRACKGKYGKRDGGDGSPFSLSYVNVILILITGILFLIFLVMFIVSPILVDPLFLYVPTINENIKCLALDEKLKKAVIVLRSFADVPFLLIILYRVLLTSPFRRFAYLQIALADLDVPKKARGVLPKSLIHNILAVLPIPQIVILIFLPTMRNSRSLNIMKFLNSFILLQYVVRAYPMYKICKRINKDTRERSKELAKRKTIWIRGVINFIMYILASHVLGALCSFASNLNSSTYAWESVFVIFISISGLVLFIYLLGHVQTFMQAISRKSDKRKQMRAIRPQIHFMLHEYGLQELGFRSGIYYAIKKLVREALNEDDDLVVENIFSVLPLELKKHIKRHLFLDKLKIMPRLESKDRQVLDAIMEHLKPVNCADGSYIIREGEPLDRMLFITQGTALAYKTSTTGGGSGSSSTTHLEKGNIYGEQLIGWAATSASFSSLPISTETVKSYAKVEVFVLMADRLQHVVSKQFNTQRSRPADTTLDGNDSGISEVV